MVPEFIGKIQSHTTYIIWNFQISRIEKDEAMYVSR